VHHSEHLSESGTSTICPIDEQIELAWQLREQQPEQSSQIADQLLRQPTTHLQRAQLQVIQSHAFGRELNVKQAVDCGVRALPQITLDGDRLWLCRVNGRLAAGLHSLGDIGAAQRHYHSQISTAKRRLVTLEDGAPLHELFAEELFYGYHNLAHQYFRLQDLEQAHHYYQSCYSLARGKQRIFGFLAVNHCQCYMAMGDYEIARTLANQALEIAEQLRLYRILVYVLPVVAQLARVDKNYNAAEQYLLRSIAVAREAGLYQSYVQLQLARHYMEIARTDKAGTVLEQMLPPADSIDKADYSLLKCLIAEHRNDFETALRHHKQHLADRETILTVKRENQLYAYEVANRLRELENDNKALTQHNLALKKDMQQIGADHLRMKTLAQTDSLTGLHNRRHLLSSAANLLQQASQHGGALSIAVIDIDHFKSINDQHGHQTGDHVLRILGKLLQDMLRQSDYVARYGGEEFVVLLPNSDLESSEAIMQRLRLSCEHYPWHELTVGLTVTCSIGIAQATGSESFAELFNLADQNLYNAKAQGRNRITTDRVRTRQRTAQTQSNGFDTITG